MKSVVNRKIILSGEYYEYGFERKRIKNINLRIRSDGTMYVSAPMRVSDRAVEEFIRSRESFIVNALTKVKERAARNRGPDVIYSGVEVRVFGEKKTVTLVEARRNDVVMAGDRIVICAKDINDLNSVTRVYNKWRSDYLKRKIIHICSEVQPFYVKLGARAPALIRFRTMKSRWGSCRPAEGIITFNNNLAEVPEECIRYVVIHEYAHLLVPDHSERFYRYVSLLMPDWKEKRRILNEY